MAHEKIMSGGGVQRRTAAETASSIGNIPGLMDYQGEHYQAMKLADPKI